MDIEALKDCIGGLSKNIFYCGANSDQAPVIYAKDKASKKQLQELFSNKAKTDAEFKSIKVELTSALGLEKARSLEQILARVPHESIYFDPTATIERGLALLSIARHARELLGGISDGCYFNSEKRNIHFMVKSPEKGRILNLELLRERLEPIIVHYTQQLSTPFYYTITISVNKPQGEVIAIDNASIALGKARKVFKKLVSGMKLPLVAASVTSALGVAPAHAAQSSSRVAQTKSMTGVNAPAVEKTTLWVDAGANYIHTDVKSRAGGSVGVGVAVPLAQQLGAQLYVNDGAAAGRNLFTVDGYIFWRQPTSGLVGPHVLYAGSGNQHTTFAGLYGEAYLNDWTIGAEGGNAFRSNRGDKGYGSVMLNWYSSDQVQLHAGAGVLGGDVVGVIGTEFVPAAKSFPGLAIFADAGVGSHDFSAGFLGIRWYFSDSTLKHIHRYMDPPHAGNSVTGMFMTSSA